MLLLVAIRTGRHQPLRACTPWAFLLLLLGLGRASAQGLLTPTVCVEYPPGQATNYLARFGYISENSGNIVLGANTADNYLYPVRNPPGEPSTFVPGVTVSAFTVLLPVNSTEMWQLNGRYILAASDAYYSAANSTESAPLAYSPTCPVVIEPAQPSLSSAGTFTNVFLGQVDSGPVSGVALTLLQNSPAVTVSNLTYVPTDPANPANSLNPNSIYGTVTVKQSRRTTTPVLLGLLDGSGAALARVLVPIVYAGPEPASGIQVPSVTTPYGTASTPVQALIAFSAAVPTGAVTITLDGGTPTPATCMGTSSPLTCTASFNTAALALGNHTLAATQAADAFYEAASSTGTLTVVQATPTITWMPATNVGYEGYGIGTGVLDATANTSGAVNYSSLAAGSTTSNNANASTALALGTYTLTALFTPTDTTDYTSATATQPFTVVPQSVFVFGTLGRYGSYLNTGTPLAPLGTTHGGNGAAVDATGNVWSIGTDGSTLARFTDRGRYSTSFSAPGGMNGAKTLAADGANLLWIANGNGTVSVVNAATGAAVYSSPVAAAGNIAAPTGIAIDASGSVWIANSGNNTATEIIGAASPVTTPAVQAVAATATGTRP